MLKEFTLEGKTALITGGGTGIGKGIALVFAEAGADVAIASRNMNNLKPAAEEIQKRHGRRVVTIQTDVTDSAQADAMVAKATDELGRVDILINNAGYEVIGVTVPLPGPSLPDFIVGESKVRMSDENWHKIVNTNLSGPFYTCRAVAPQMMERRNGKIINIASNNSVLAEPYGAPYASSKAALKMLTRVLANEWGPYNVNVNCIAPGTFITEMMPKDYQDPEKHQEMVEGIPLKRLTDIRDLGLLALYLACPASDWMTGQFMNLDGGEMAIYNW